VLRVADRECFLIQEFCGSAAHDVAPLDARVRTRQSRSEAEATGRFSCAEDEPAVDKLRSIHFLITLIRHKLNSRLIRSFHAVYPRTLLGSLLLWACLPAAANTFAGPTFINTCPFEITQAASTTSRKISSVRRAKSSSMPIMSSSTFN
jgi:hypothetical protein